MKNRAPSHDDAPLSIQITYRGIDSSETLSGLIHREARKLEIFFERIVKCHVIIERDQRHAHGATPLHVRVDLGVPGAELAVETAGKDAAVAIREAFRRTRRRLQDYARRRKG